jgi:hypothetical protein
MSIKRSQIGRVVRLSKKTADSLASHPLKVARKQLEDLECWRNESMRSEITIN